MLDFGFATEQEIRAELGARLKAHRLAQGLTQQVLAERAGIGVNTLKLLESKGQCVFETVVRVVIGLGLADEFQNLFVLKARSIAQMEQAERVTRKRAPRASSVRRRNAGGEK